MKTNTYVILAICILALLLSISSIVRILNILPMYTNSEARNAVLQSTLSLESKQGILLSTIHLKSVAMDNHIVTSHYTFRYYSQANLCRPKQIYVYYDTLKHVVIDSRIPFEEKNETIC